jgi:uncharacterized protein YoxC
MNPGQNSFLALAVAVMIFFYMVVSSQRRIRRNVDQIDESLEMSRRSMALAEENMALNRETNRLLEELIAAVREIP